MATIRTLMVVKSWFIPYIDVKKIFLHGDLKETIYMHVPAGIDTPASSVCRLH